MNNIIKESGTNYVSHYSDNTTGFKCLREYDENGNMVYYKDSEGRESWLEYNKKYRKLYFKNSDGSCYCKTYNKRGKLISYTPYIIKEK